MIDNGLGHHEDEAARLHEAPHRSEVCTEHLCVGQEVGRQQAEIPGSLWSHHAGCALHRSLQALDLRLEPQLGHVAHQPVPARLAGGETALSDGAGVRETVEDRLRGGGELTVRLIVTETLLGDAPIWEVLIAHDRTNLTQKLR